MMCGCTENIFYLDENFCEKRPDGFSVRIVRSRAGEYVEKLEICIKNNGEKGRIIPFFEVRRKGKADFYMIPCVNYNGNFWGTGQEPKGMERDGVPWIFSSDRSGLPGGSVAVNGGVCTAVFADNAGLSENSSASLFERDGDVVQRVYFSHLEFPLVYLRKFEYGAPIARFLTFDRGEEKRFVCFLYTREIRDGNIYYAYRELFDFLNSGEYYQPVPPRYTAEETKRMSWEFFRSLTEKTPDGYLSNMGLLPDGEHRMGDASSRFRFRKFGKYEIGWCGQNITAAEMYLRSYREEGAPGDLEKGTGILDTWMKRRFENGLVAVNFDAPFGEESVIDTCNEGWLLYKLPVCCRILSEAGFPKEKYEQTALGICRFFTERYPTGIFPQMVRGDGSPVSADGCAGAMLMLGFLSAYEYFGKKEFLSRAAEAFSAYYEIYLSRSVAAGGALDTCCIDKESAGPVLRSALLLSEITGDKKYLDYAENIAHYLMTWMFYHDVPFEKDSDCARLGLRTTGGTAVSAAHHHIDCWGIFYVPDLYFLYQKTGNRAYALHARALWNFTLQYMSDGNLTLHGMRRPAGAQNEAVVQCNWHGTDESKGCLNDWLVAWVKSFQLDVWYALKDENFFEEENG